MKPYAYQIDTLRFVAMLAVFMTHCTLLKMTENGLAFYNKYCIFAGYAVEFFIMLSGLLQAYFFKEFDIHDRRAYLGYIKKRALRLFPLHWVCMLIFLPLSFLFLGPMPAIRAFVPTALLLQSCHRLTVLTINGPAWTISVLFILTIATPWLMNNVRKLSNAKVCVAILFVMFFVEHFQFLWLEELRPKDVWFFYASPHARILNYMEGLVLGHLLKNFTTMTFVEKHATILETIIIGIFLFTTVKLQRQFFFVYSSMAIMLYVLFLGKGFISRVLSAKVFQNISKLSFAFYLIHYTFISLGNYIIAIKMYPNGVVPINICIITLVAAFVLSLISAWILHEFIEQRLTALFARTKLFSI